MVKDSGMDSYHRNDYNICNRNRRMVERKIPQYLRQAAQCVEKNELCEAEMFINAAIAGIKCLRYQEFEEKEQSQDNGRRSGDSSKVREIKGGG